MEKLTHWKKLINPDYLGAYSLDGLSELNVTIEKVVREMVTGTGGKKEECTVAYLKNQKPFIINRTNGKTITKVLKSPYVEEWSGKSITLYATTTKVAGEEVECLRVRPVAPVVKNEEHRFRACKTTAELVALWKEIGCPAYEKVKNEMKQKLQNETPKN